jgi:hypothetical protein
MAFAAIQSHFDCRGIIPQHRMNRMQLEIPIAFAKLVCLAPLRVDEFVDGMFKIKPEDVKRIVASKPGKGKKK